MDLELHTKEEVVARVRNLIAENQAALWVDEFIKNPDTRDIVRFVLVDVHGDLCVWERKFDQAYLMEHRKEP